MDNLFIERLWRSLKYEPVYLAEPEDGFQAERRTGTGWSFTTESGLTRRWAGERRKKR